MLLFPRGNDEKEHTRDKVLIYLKNCGTETQVVRYDFAVLTKEEYWPTDPV